MILPAQAIRAIVPAIVSPFCERSVHEGMSYGLSIAGYDIRIAENVELIPGAFKLASSMERFCMPLDVIGKVTNKSTWRRQGLDASGDTVIEPGWCGFLTLELKNDHDSRTIRISAGMPIAQVLFTRCETPCEAGYSGKYQDQESGAQKARFEK